jgi:hypothetical protein
MSPRGRPPRKESAEPTGYRASVTIRRHIDLARAFLSVRSQQDFIDLAVRDYLDRLREANPQYSAAARALDDQIRHESQS